MANKARSLSPSARGLLDVLQERSIVETFSSIDAAELIANGYVERFRDGLIVTDAGLAYKPRDPHKHGGVTARRLLER